MYFPLSLGFLIIKQTNTFPPFYCNNYNEDGYVDSCACIPDLAHQIYMAGLSKCRYYAGECILSPSKAQYQLPDSILILPLLG